MEFIVKESSNVLLLSDNNTLENSNELANVKCNITTQTTKEFLDSAGKDLSFQQY